MLKAVIFDFDGVITDSEVLHFRAFNEVLRQFDIHIELKDYYSDYLGLSDKDLFTLFVNQGKLNLDGKGIDGLIKTKNKVFEEMAESESQIISGVKDFLEMLNENGIPMTICSGALRPEIELILEKAGLRHFFVDIVSAEDVRIGKPEPEGFLLSLAHLNEKLNCQIKPEECIVIEDSHWGLQAGNNAGMNTIAITNSYQADQLKTAKLTISHLNELSIDKLRSVCN